LNQRQQTNADDYVRSEVELGLRQKHITVIPVLVDGARMPAESEVPVRMATLPFQNAAQISALDFDSDVDALIAKIKPRGSLLPVGIGALLLLIAFVAVLLLVTNNPTTNATQTPTVATSEVPDVVQNPTTVVPSITLTTVTPNETPTPTLTSSVTHPPPTLTETVDLNLLALTYDAEQTSTQAAVIGGEMATESAAQTAIATVWTPTLTPNITASFEAFLTQRAAATATASAAHATATADLWTDTPTYTRTSSPTPTTTFTSTFTPSPTPSPIPLGLSLDNPVTTNAEWLSHVDDYARDFDGVAMVLVPAGCFQMGNDRNTSVGGEDGGRQCLGPFWIDRYEVTNAQFALFGGQAANDSNFSGNNRPREQITWFEARDYCVLRGARLPTEAEWEYAARGVDGLYYPWGNEWDPDNVVWSGNSNYETADVGSRPNGRSWVGAYDLSGNVWEWVSSLYRDYPYTATDRREDLDSRATRVLRGASWDNNVPAWFRAADRSDWNPRNANGNVGIRCARSYTF
ncbi:MAG: SUMF1/EgtB/PvdO family nonheme iron enzyme, partial [Anaerolinea sp.]|nr:SUMF1/EgtB/PvdO family nonheme iron enzyme [Anaerolinea sp.]